jgi:hypothetical protein
MEAPTAGNGIMSLVQQLIAAKLNVLSGADDSSIFQAIINADKMIDDAGGKIVPPYTSPFLAPAVTSALNTALTNFNAGVTGPGRPGRDVVSGVGRGGGRCQSRCHSAVIVRGMGSHSVALAGWGWGLSPAGLMLLSVTESDGPRRRGPPRSAF